MQNEARKANQTAMVGEKKRMEAPEESRGISKQKWLEERKKKIGRLLDANGLEMSNAYMLDTQEMAESKYKKWDKEPAPAGWDGKIIALTYKKYIIYLHVITRQSGPYTSVCVCGLACLGAVANKRVCLHLCGICMFLFCAQVICL